jgi:hypothetical protein
VLQLLLVAARPGDVGEADAGPEQDLVLVEQGRDLDVEVGDLPRGGRPFDLVDLGGTPL